jgi:hypothetical protein
VYFSDYYGLLIAFLSCTFDYGDAKLTELWLYLTICLLTP